MIIWNISPPILHAYELMKRTEDNKKARFKRKWILLKKKRRERLKQAEISYYAFLLKNLLKDREYLEYINSNNHLPTYLHANELLSNSVKPRFQR